MDDWMIGTVLTMAYILGVAVTIPRYFKLVERFYKNEFPHSHMAGYITVSRIAWGALALSLSWPIVATALLLHSWVVTYCTNDNSKRPE